MYNLSCPELWYFFLFKFPLILPLRWAALWVHTGQKLGLPPNNAFCYLPILPSFLEWSFCFIPYFKCLRPYRVMTIPGSSHAGEVREQTSSHLHPCCLPPGPLALGQIEHCLEDREVCSLHPWGQGRGWVSGFLKGLRGSRDPQGKRRLVPEPHKEHSVVWEKVPPAEKRIQLQKKTREGSQLQRACLLGRGPNISGP